MKLVIGRGNNRKVYELPHGSQFVRGMKDEPDTVRLAINNICDLMEDREVRFAR